LLKTAGTPTEIALNASFITLGGIFAGVLYSLLATFVGRARPALVGVFILIIPVVYLFHVGRDITTKPVVALLNQAVPTASAEMQRWIKQNLSATPLVVEACDQVGALNASVALGLPRFVESQATGEVKREEALCGVTDPEAAYRRMMSQGLEFFVTSSLGSTTNPTARKRFEQFSSRPDLLARVFDDGKVAIFVPAFSGYYPRLMPS